MSGIFCTPRTIAEEVSLQLFPKHPLPDFVGRRLDVVVVMAVVLVVVVVVAVVAVDVVVAVIVDVAVVAGRLSAWRPCCGLK